MSTDNFYSELPTFNTFIEITHTKNFVSIPHDWSIIITDICGSTELIESGRYKEVNLLGAATIVAALNVAGKNEIPYVFGGDGASILVPPSLLEKIKQALVATQNLAKHQFGIELRVGVVPVVDVIQAGYEVRIARLKVSENYVQSVFTGGGLNHANNLIKDPLVASHYGLKTTGKVEADFSGLECRWQNIPGKNQEIVSLLVLAVAHDEEQNSAIYREVFENIQAIYGRDENLNPIVPRNLKLSFSPKMLTKEMKIHIKSSHWFNQQLYLLKMRLDNLLKLLFIKFKAHVDGVDWGNYSSVLIDSTDYKKFDDMLRMIISGDAVHREQLVHYLEQGMKAGKLVYGLHASDRALMTCLVFERNGRQVHFLDGADGGYALAAKPLKQRMQRKVNNWRAYTEIAKLKKTLKAEGEGQNAENR